MKTNKPACAFFRWLFIGCTNLYFLAFGPQLATAQNNEVVELEEFAVEGYREGKSLAIQQKRNASNLRDIISADSIGNLPDDNVADALVRLPGVSIDMEQGEGRFVSIRGIAPELNNVTINGANIANPSVGGRNGRAAPLDVIGSSQVTSLEVIKAMTPDMDAQGLGGTVNLITASGFDKEQSFFNGSFEGGLNTKTGENGQKDDVQYTVEGTYGTRLGANKNIAIALTGSYEFRPFQTEAVDIRFRDGFDADTDGDGDLESKLVLPGSIEVVPEFGTRRRVNISGKIEFRPNEDTEFFVEGLYSEFTEWQDEVEDIFEVEREAFFVGDGVAFSPFADSVEIRRFEKKRTQELINITSGVKKKFGNLTLSSKFTYAYQEEVNDTKNLQFRGRRLEVQPGMAPITSIDGVAIPMIDALCGGDGVCEEGERIPVLMSGLLTSSEPKFSLRGLENTALNLIPHRRNQVNRDFSDEETFIPQFDAQWDTDNFLGTGHSGFFKAGFKYFDRERQVDDNVFRTSEVPGLTLADIPNATIGGREVLSFNTGQELNFDAIFNDFFGGVEGVMNNLPVDEAAILENNVEDDFIFNEEIIAVYGMFEVNIGERLTLTGGVRYEDTEVDMIANQTTRFRQFDPNNPPDFSLCDGGFSADQEFCVSTAEGNVSFDNVLPNIQARYEIRDNLIFRAAFTSTIGRPNFEDTSPIQFFEWEDERFDEMGDPVEGGELNGEAELKNPGLQPFESDNIDVSLEYYMKNGGVLAVSFFYKDIENPIFEFDFEETNISLTEAQQITMDRINSPLNTIGLGGDEVFNSIRFTGFDNAESGDITGVELSAYLPFTFLPAPFDGFGVDSNFTFIDSEVDVIGREDEDLPFFKQPDFIANVAVFYQKGPFEGRVAFRHQDSTLDELGGSAELDLYSDERSQWDAQISYRMNDHWKVFAKFQNFTNETDDNTHGDNPLTLKDREDFGATYRFGVSWNY